MPLTWEWNKVGSRFNDSIDGGITYTRIGVGKGLVQTTEAARLKEVYDDAGLPGFGDALDPTDWPNLKVATRDIRIVCRNKVLSAEVNLGYRTFAGGFLPIPDDTGPVIVTSSDVALTNVRTPFDRTGALITVQHELDTQTPVVDDLVPVSSFETFRVQNTDPRTLNDDHAGTLNNAVWNGYAARTVRFDGVASVTRDGGDSFECTYRFSHRPDGWDVFVWYEDEDGKVPETLVNGTGYKQIERLKETNFGSLNISL